MEAHKIAELLVASLLAFGSRNIYFAKTQQMGQVCFDWLVSGRPFQETIFKLEQ